jgi:hypothetical protein
LDSKTIIPFTFTGILRSSVSFFLYTELHMSNNVINKKMFREHLPESPISDQTSNSRYQDIPTRHPPHPQTHPVGVTMLIIVIIIHVQVDRALAPHALSGR